MPDDQTSFLKIVRRRLRLPSPGYGGSLGLGQAVIRRRPRPMSATAKIDAVPREGSARQGRTVTYVSTPQPRSARPPFGKRNFAASRLQAAFGGRRSKTPSNSCRRPVDTALTLYDVAGFYEAGNHVGLRGLHSNCEPLRDAFVNVQHLRRSSRPKVPFGNLGGQNSRMPKLTARRGRSFHVPRSSYSRPRPKAE